MRLIFTPDRTMKRMALPGITNFIIKDTDDRMAFSPGILAAYNVTILALRKKSGCIN